MENRIRQFVHHHNCNAKPFRWKYTKEQLSDLIDKLREKGLYPPPLGPLQVEGIGKVRRRRLLDHFGTVSFIKRTSVAEIASVKGMTPQLAEKLSEHLRDRAV